MEIQYDLSRKLCIVWVNSSGKNDAALQKALEPIYRIQKDRGYKTVVFYTGTQELYERTLDLLLHNKSAIL